MCDTPETRREVVKKALFGELLNEQLKENYANLKTFKEKQIFVPTVQTRRGSVASKYFQTVRKLYENDDNSRIGAGKRECVTRKGVEKQRVCDGKSAPDGVGATCKRTADDIVATRDDIDSLESFSDAIQRRCPGISLLTIDAESINKMTSDIQKQVNNLKSFCGTLKVHQVKGKITRCPLGLPQEAAMFIMKNSEGEDESRLELDLPDNNTNNDSIKKDVIAQNTLRNKSNTESENMARTSSIQQYNVDDYVLVEFPVRKMEYRYAAIINQIDNEEGEITITFMKICDDKGHTFKIDEKVFLMYLSSK
ncbi:hypothetical protein HHI36_005873 [Cryptolaemus montrouzieri]|uniref:Uncharacterized protein n=1 Tax=Cryptolaemus montrouzieri TaxID=559131 RepID=A0ABD2NWA4_9CUCU